METWTVTLQTDLSREALYDELLALKKKLKISAFFIEGYDVQEQQAADVESIRRQMRGVWIHEEFKEAHPQ